VPDVFELSLFPPERSSVGRPKLDAPPSNCLAGDGDTALGKQVLDVAQAEREPMVEADGMADDFRREDLAIVTRDALLEIISLRKLNCGSMAACCTLVE